MRFSLIWQNLFYSNFIKVKVPLSPPEMRNSLFISKLRILR